MSKSWNPGKRQGCLRCRGRKPQSCLAGLRVRGSFRARADKSPAWPKQCHHERESSGPHMRGKSKLPWEGRPRQVPESSIPDERHEGMIRNKGARQDHHTFHNGHGWRPERDGQMSRNKEEKVIGRRERKGLTSFFGTCLGQMM